MTDFIEKTFGSYLISTVDLSNNDILTLYTSYGAGDLNTSKYVDDNLIGYYEFNDDGDANPSIEVFVEDSSTYGNNGILVGSAFISNGILSLNGIDSGVDLVASNILSPNDNSWTQSLWFQSDMGTSIGIIQIGILTLVRSGGGSATNIQLNPSGVGYLEVRYRNSVGWESLLGPTLATLGAGWHHVVYSYDGTTSKLYVDGVLYNSAVDSTFLGFSSDIARIGHKTGIAFFEGSLDNVMIFDKVLSLSEIQYLYSIQNKIEGFSSVSEQIVIKGIPLSLSIYNGSFTNTFGESGVIYAINTIERSNISGESLSCVWNGNLLGVTKDENSRYNLDIAGKNNSSVPVHNVVLFGFPLGTEENGGLVLMNSGYSTSDIEEYEEITLGGMPLIVGRIGESWYLITNMVKTY